MNKGFFKTAGWLAAATGLLALASCGESKDKKPTTATTEADGPALVDFKLLDRTILKRHEDAPPLVIFPEELKAEDNKRISIVGFMAPFEEMDNMKRFMLLPSYVGCF